MQLCDIRENKAACEHGAKTMREFRAYMDNWHILEEIIDVLRILYDATVFLQKSEIGLSDFYGCWLKINFKLSQHVSQSHQHTDLAEKLLNGLDDRKHTLIDNNVMDMALFLDRRFSLELTAQRIGVAKMSLIRLFRRMESMSEPEVAESDASNAFNTSDALLEAYFKDKHVTGDTPGAVPEENGRISDGDLLRKFSEFESKENIRWHSNTNILTRWIELRGEYPVLYALASVILAIPPTQCDVERDFSELSLVFGSKRYNLKQSTLESILLLKLNPEIYYDVCHQHMQELQE